MMEKPTRTPSPEPGDVENGYHGMLQVYRLELVTSANPYQDPLLHRLAAHSCHCNPRRLFSKYANLPKSQVTFRPLKPYTLVYRANRVVTTPV
jgi:hypothetical protein